MSTKTLLKVKNKMAPISLLEIAQLPALYGTNKMANTLSYGERITLILDEQKRSKAWLAQQIGITKQAMNYLMNHSRKPKYVSEIACVLNVNPEWLKAGIGNVILPTSAPYQNIKHIPLLAPSDIPLLQEKKTQSTQSVMADGSLSENCFAMRLDNHSMEPLFKQGTILIFDPELKPTTGDFVVFTLNKNVSFRQFFIEGADIYLKAADPMYRIMANEDTIIHGVLVESRNIFK